MNLKRLIVCLSTDLPKEKNRDENCLYFVYNTLVLYMGKTVYGENFCIVDTMPGSPTIDMLYICLDDGKVKLYEDYTVKEIAEVESREMINVLMQCGTMYYFNSKVRYLDKVNRMLVLPFQNGSYNLTVDVPNDLLYNEQTVIIFNPDTNRFEIYGETYDEDPLETKGFVGKESQTVSIKVKDGRIEGDVKISEEKGNLIRVVEDGLFLQVHDAITQKEFDSWKGGYENYKIRLDYYMKSIMDDLSNIETLVSEEVIDRKIHTYLQQVYPMIDQAIADYNDLNTRINEALVSYEEYAQNRFDYIERTLTEEVEEALTNPWGDLGGGDEPTPEPEPDPEPDPEPEPEEPTPEDPETPEEEENP